MAFSALTLLVGRQEGNPACKKWWGAGVVICLQRGADLHTAQLMPLPLTVSCFSKIQIGCTFLVPAHPGNPGQRPLNRFDFLFFLTKLQCLPLTDCDDTVTDRQRATRMHRSLLQHAPRISVHSFTASNSVSTAAFHSWPQPQQALATVTMPLFTTRCLSVSRPIQLRPSSHISTFFQVYILQTSTVNFLPSRQY